MDGKTCVVLVKIIKLSQSTKNNIYFSNEFCIVFCLFNDQTTRNRNLCDKKINNVYSSQHVSGKGKRGHTFQVEKIPFILLCMVKYVFCNSKMIRVVFRALHNWSVYILRYSFMGTQSTVKTVNLKKVFCRSFI